MKMNKKAFVAVLLVGSMLLSACSEKETTKNKRKNKKEKHSTKSEKLYTLDDIEDKTNASEIREGIYFSNDCYVVESTNDYNNVRFIIFDSEKDAQKFYEDSVESYLLDTDYSDDKYSIGWEYGVCDASIKDMILIDKNVVMVAELEFWGEWAVSDEDDYEPSGSVYIDEDDIERIVKEWS